jgi:iron(III) transport system permease protein
VRVYTTEVFTAFAALYDFSRATVLALPLLLISVVVTIIAVVVAGERLLSTRRSSGARPAFIEGWQRPAEVLVFATTAIAVGVPLVALAGEASGVASMWMVLEGSGPAIVKSLVLAAIGATAVVSVAIWLGYARARATGRLAQLADVLFVVAFAIPSTIVGVGLIGVWNRPGVVGDLYGTDVMFVLGYLARFVPVAALTLAATMRYVPVSHEEAAAIAGAGWWRTMTHVVLPQARLGVLVAWIIAFVLAFGELGVSVLIAPPGESTLPIRIYTIIANAPASHTAALALLQAAVILVPVVILAVALVWRPVSGGGAVSGAGRPGEAR